jgi:nucleotide-binding universal stress UspA family protein
MEHTKQIVVAVDGTERALEAAQWAAAMAVRLGAPLHLVHVMSAVDEALLEITTPQQADAGAHPRELSRAVLERVANAVRTDHPALRISSTLSHRSREEVLVDLSRHARMVILACADVSPAGALLTGSTVLKIIGHSACPVAAWRGDAVAPTGRPVVVGVELRGGDAALSTAFGLADSLGVGLMAVHATSRRRAPGEIDIPVLVDWEALEAVARRRLVDVVAPVAEHWPHVDVDYAVETARAGRAILHHAADAQLVVIGTRGRGNVVSALLGSTGLTLLHHSPVPVVLCPASYVWDRNQHDADTRSLHPANADPR